MTIEEAKHSSADDKLPWDVITSILGSVSGLSLILSIVYDMGYFETLGLSFADIPTTIGDHVRSALLWVPQAVTAAFGYSLLVLMKWKVSSLLDPGSGKTSSKLDAVWATLRPWPNRLLIALAFTVHFADMATGGKFGKYAAAASSVVVAYIVFDIASRSAAARHQSPAKLLALCAFPVITIFAYNYGTARALDEQERPRQATITLEGQREVHLTIYRYLDRGILASPDARKVVFYRWEDIKLLSASYQAKQRTNWACKVINVACSSMGKPAAINASSPPP